MSTPVSLRRALAVVVTFSLGLAALVAPAYADPGPTVRISPPGTSPGATASSPSISDDGTVVVFTSSALGLVPEVESGPHLYALDRATSTIRLVDVNSDGTASDTNQSGINPGRVSGNGRFVVFTSSTLTLAERAPMDCVDSWGEAEQCPGVYLRDLHTGTTTVVSRTSAGEYANDWAAAPAISDDGRRIVFVSRATNLDPALPAGQSGVFLADLDAGTVRLVSVASDGTPADRQAVDPTISGDGSVVAFVSTATNLGSDPTPGSEDVFLHDVATGVTTAVLAGLGDLPESRSSGTPGLDDDGSVVAFITQHQLLPEDPTRSWTTYRLDRATGSLAAPHPDALSHSQPQLTDDGRLMLFTGQGGSLPAAEPVDRGHVYVYDAATGQTTPEGVRADGSVPSDSTHSGPDSISGDGRFVGFWSYADDVVAGPHPGGSSVFLHDRALPAEASVGDGAATTDSEGDGATVLDPVEATVTGSPGPVSIEELSLDDPAAALPTGWTVFGQPIRVSADPPEAPAYLTLTFDFDASVVPMGADPASYSLLRDGVALPGCAGPADRGPCLQSTDVLADGDWRFVAHSPAASIWALAAGGPVEPTDQTPPTITVNAPAQDAVYTQGEQVPADYACADEDSGIASCTGDVPAGEAVDTSAVGIHTFRVQAADEAGNPAEAVVTYRVVFDFAGFFGPVDEPPVVNVVRAGRSVPLVFSLGGFQGYDVFEAGYPLSRPVGCPPDAPRDRVERTVPVELPDLTYRNGHYLYAWDTQRDWWSPECRELVVRFADGTEHTALFRLM